ALPISGADVEDHVVEGGPQRAVPDVELLVELLVAQAPAQLQDPSRRPAVVSQESVEQIHRRSSASLRCRMYGPAPACYVAGLELIVVRTSNVCSEAEYGRCRHLTSRHAGFAHRIPASGSNDIRLLAQTPIVGV